MGAPNLASEQVAAACPKAAKIGSPVRGGQKQVFPCEIDGTRYALKFLATDPTVPADAEGLSEEPFDEVLSRARREIAIMATSVSPHLVKLGPIPLSHTEIGGQRLVYFTEEWIEGDDLRTCISRGALPIADVVRLGIHICLAIEELWKLRKVHRDIKPGNIMIRGSSGDFVLLDLGMAFDLDDDSLSDFGVVPGTLKYFSPEQTDYTKKRALDFRSDLFALGIVMYEAATGSHPFVSRGMSSHQALAAILNAPVIPPKTLRPELPEMLDEIIIRLLAKRPHLRYRRCEDLRAALAAVQVGA